MSRALAVALVIALAPPAWAGRVAVAGFEGPRAEADALTLLVRSMLSHATRPSVPGRELKQALSGQARVEVGSAAAKHLFEATGADRLVLGSLEREGRQLKVSYRIYDRSFDPAGAGAVSGAASDVDGVALVVAQHLGRLLGDEADAQARATADELQPFLQASGPDKKGALRTADPDVAKRVSEARAIADELAGDASAEARDRVEAALAAGEAPRAVEVAKASTALPAGTRARAFIAAGDLPSARKELKRTADPDAPLARAELTLAEGHTSDGAHQLMALAAQDPLAALRLAALPPGALGDDEASTLAVAAHAPPAVAARLVARAAKSGVTVPADAVPFDSLPTRALEIVVNALPPQSPTASTVGVLLKERDAPRVTEDTPPPAQAAAAAAAPPAAKAKATAPAATEAAPAPRRAVTPEVAALADTLDPLLDVFPSLAAHPEAAARLARLRHAGGFGPRAVDDELLALGLAEALQRDTRKLHPLRAGDTDSVDALAEAGPELAAAFRATPKGDRAEVELFVRDTDGKTQHERLLVPSHRSGLVSLRVSFFVVMLALVVAAAGGLGFAAWRIRHVGHVRVDLRNLLGSEKDALALRLSRSATAPVIDDAAEFDQKERRRGPRTAFGRRSLAAGTTEFHRVAAGEWYVHLYGVFTREGQLHTLPPLTRLVQVRTGETERVFFELTRDAVPVRVLVTDGQPFKGARVWVGDGGEVLQTGDDGEVRMRLPAGEHLVRVEARGVLAERPITIATASVDVTVDLIAERKRTLEATDAAS